MKGKLEIQVNGVVLAELENPISTCGVNDILSYSGLIEGQMRIIPWPLDEDGNPIPIELSREDFKKNIRISGP